MKTSTPALVRDLALSLVLLSSPGAMAQEAEPKPSSDWFRGQATFVVLGHNDIASSKFQEYRVVPKGVSAPSFSLRGRSGEKDYAVFAENISERDQRYQGWAAAGGLGVSFDYNQIPHAFGNGGQSILNQVGPGEWRMSSTLRQTLGNAVDTRLPTTTRTYQFFADLFAPTIAAANRIDLEGLRQRGLLEVDLGSNLPFDLKFSYMRERKTGTRGTGGGLIGSAVNSFVEVPEPLNDLIQDAGVAVALTRDWGGLQAGFHHNWYDNRQETLLVDNPLRPSDLAYTAASGAIPALGGPGTARFIGPADNSANSGSFGARLKFARQTRVNADVVLSRWRQNAQFYPYTINTTILTPAGVRADSTAALQKQSLDGRIDSTTFNLGMSSRPAENFALRARYRVYDMDNKTPAFVRTGSAGSSPDRSFTAVTPSTDAPLGFVTANIYSHRTARFDASASYDIKDLTLEAGFRHAAIERTSREASEGSERGLNLAAVLRAGDKFNFRGSFDDSTRTAKGYDPAASLGLQADESERDTTRVGLNLEFNPTDKVGLVLAYARRNDDYPNRPNRIAGAENTQNGLLNAKYDLYTIEVMTTPSDRADLSAYYTRENNVSKTRYGSGVVINMLDFVGSDETDTFGGTATFRFVPDRWTFAMNAQHQRLDGLMDIMGNPAGSFALARAAFGGIQDIADYSDTKLTTVRANLDFTPRESLVIGAGYTYEKYDYADAYSEGTEVYPAIGGFYLKANDGAYKAHVVFARVTYRF